MLQTGLHTRKFLHGSCSKQCGVMLIYPVIYRLFRDEEELYKIQLLIERLASQLVRSWG
jgi:hypothetical protein